MHRKLQIDENARSLMSLRHVHDLLSATLCWSSGYLSGLAGSRLRLEQQAHIVPVGAASSASSADGDSLQREGSTQARNGVIALPKWAAEGPCLVWLWLDVGAFSLCCFV